MSPTTAEDSDTVVESDSCEEMGLGHSDSSEESDYDYPHDEHERLEPRERHVVIICKDSHDEKGPGMTFKLPWMHRFKTIFNHFKARSCKNCRAPNEMRFKSQDTTVSEGDTPEKVR